MLKIRIIPTLLWKNLGLVKGKSFDSWRPVGTVLPAIKVYNTREVDELILLDVIATVAKQDPDYLEIESLTAECFVPLTFGGGIHSVDQVRKILCAGADKVSVNSAAFENPSLVTDIAKQFGSQCVVASVDVQKNSLGQYECFSHAGKRATGRMVVEWCVELEQRGAGEIMLTAIERDGTMCGYDLDLINAVATQVKIPVIASGGAGTYEHFLQAIQAGAAAVAAAAMFHYTEQTPRGAKDFLKEKGIPVRSTQARLS